MSGLLSCCFLRSGHFLVSGFGKFGCTSGSFSVHLRGCTKRKQSNKSINLTGNSRVLKRWAARGPAGYFTVVFQSWGNAVLFLFSFMASVYESLEITLCRSLYFLGFAKYLWEGTCREFPLPAHLAAFTVNGPVLR